MVTIRAATGADEERIRELVFGVLAEYGLRPDPEGADADLCAIEAAYWGAGGLFEVVEDDGRLIGTVGLYPLGGGACELRKMYLAREARGRGLGRRLMERMIEEARRLGFWRIELETASCLVEAIGLYRRFGFVPLDHAPSASRCDVVMALDLPAGPPGEEHLG